MRRLVAALVIIAPLAGLYAAGGPALGHCLLSLGFPAAAARFFDDPAWKGVALYAAGRWSESAAAFGPAPENAYNRGDALARAGRYAEAVDAFATALAFDPENDDARANGELIGALLAGQSYGPAKRNGGVANADATRQLIGGRTPPAESRATSSGTGLAGWNEASTTGAAQGAGSVARSGGGDGESTQKGSGRATGSSGNAAGEGRSGGVLASVARLEAALGSRANRRLEFHAVLPTRDWLATMPDDPGAFLKLQIRAEARRRMSPPPGAGDGDGY
jgi:tetratricopeptide (TPR) repeat protein